MHVAGAVLTRARYRRLTTGVGGAGARARQVMRELTVAVGRRGADLRAMCTRCLRGEERDRVACLPSIPAVGGGVAGAGRGRRPRRGARARARAAGCAAWPRRRGTGGRPGEGWRARGRRGGPRRCEAGDRRPLAAVWATATRRARPLAARAPWCAPARLSSRARVGASAGVRYRAGRVARRRGCLLGPFSAGARRLTTLARWGATRASGAGRRCSK